MRRVGVVLFGAAQYDYAPHLDNPRFRASATEFRRVFRDEKIVPESEFEFLNLYDQKIAASKLAPRIIDWLKKSPVDDLVLYYCGHGSGHYRLSGYSVFLRSTNPAALKTSVLNVRDVMSDLQEHLLDKFVVVILDACYSGKIIEEYDGRQSAALAAQISDEDLLPHTGLAYFTAAGAGDVALAKEEDATTLFTGAIIKTLREGSKRCRSPVMSWRDVKDQVSLIVTQRLRTQAPIPKLQSVDERGDMTVFPFFRNAAFVPEDTRQTVPSFDERQLEYAYWMNIEKRKDPALYEDFLNRHPSGNFSFLAASTAKEIIQACEDVALLENYLKVWPNSPRAADAFRRIAQLKWNEGKSYTTPDRVHEFIKLYPETPAAQEAFARLFQWQREKEEAAKPTPTVSEQPSGLGVMDAVRPEPAESSVVSEPPVPPLRPANEPAAKLSDLRSVANQCVVALSIATAAAVIGTSGSLSNILAMAHVAIVLASAYCLVSQWRVLPGIQLALLWLASGISAFMAGFGIAMVAPVNEEVIHAFAAAWSVLFVTGSVAIVSLRRAKHPLPAELLVYCVCAVLGGLCWVARFGVEPVGVTIVVGCAAVLAWPAFMGRSKFTAGRAKN